MVVDSMKSDQNRAACQLRIQDSGDQSGEDDPGRSQRAGNGVWVSWWKSNDSRMFGGFEINERPSLTTGRTQSDPVAQCGLAHEEERNQLSCIRTSAESLGGARIKWV